MANKRTILIGLFVLLAILLMQANVSAYAAPIDNAPLLAAPSNDNFASAEVIASLPYTNTQSTVDATTEGNDPNLSCVFPNNQGFHSVWYKYVAGSTGRLTVDTIGSNFDTVLAVWTGSFGSLVNQDCDDDSYFLQSQVSIDVTSGTTYYIEITGYDNGNTGDLTLNVVLANSIFADSFESGDLSAWDSKKTSKSDLKACEKAAMTGSYGLCVKNKTKKSKYVQDDGFNTSAYAYQFILDPNGMKVKNKKKIRLVQARGSTNTTWMEFRRKSGKYQIRNLSKVDGGGTVKSVWITISNAPHLIEVNWRAATSPGANNGYMLLYVDDWMRYYWTGLNNDTYTIQQIKLGITNTVPVFKGKFYIDQFRSYDGGHVGPSALPASQLLESPPEGIKSTISPLGQGQ